MRFKSTVELFYLAMMLRWENTAPEDGTQGLLDGIEERNSQISRMVYILKLIASGNTDRVYNLLSIHSRRNDGNSYISKYSSWMNSAQKLDDKWYFEGCTNLIQKKYIILGLRKLDLSSAFVNAVEDFVSGKSVRRYLPSEEVQNEMIKYTDLHNTQKYRTSHFS